MNEDDAKELYKDPKISLWERGVISVAIKTIQFGDVVRLERMINMIFGDMPIVASIKTDDEKRKVFKAVLGKILE